MNVKYFFIAGFFIAARPASAGAEVWTLDRTIQTALGASSGAEVSRLAGESVLLDAESARNGWFPSFSTSASAGYVSDVMEISLPGKTIRFGDNDSYDFKLRMNQLLYDGGRLSALRNAGRSRAAANRHEADAAGLAAEFQAKTAYYSVVAAEENAGASAQSIREARSHLDMVIALRDQGMALEDDVLLSRLRVSQAEMDLVSREAERERAKALFRQTTGIAPDAEVEVTGTYHELALPDSAVETAWRLRPEFGTVESSIRTAEYSVRSARADRYPNVGFSGVYNYGRPGLNSPANDWMDWFSAGVSLSWNVWDWGRVDREIEKADIARRQVLERREELRRMVAEQVTDACAGYREAERRNALAQEAAGYAERHLALVTASFRNGETSERDYDAAHAAYAKALHDAAAARAAVGISAARVEYVTGIRYAGGNNE